MAKRLEVSPFNSQLTILDFRKILKRILQVAGILLAIILVGIFIMMNFVFPDFYKSEQEQIEIITERGQERPTFGTYLVGEQNIHYTHVGDTIKPLVLFVHGSPGSSDAFLRYLADTSLSKVCQMVTVDRPGFGESSGKGEPSMERQAAVLKPIVEKYGFGKKVLLVGHSLGGPVIARMAMDYEELLDGLIILAGSIDPELEPNEWFRPALQYAPAKWFLNRPFIASNIEIMPLEDELTEMLPLWKNITIPVTVLQGTKDKLVPVGNADFAEKMLVNSRKVDIQKIEGENHFFIWTQPEIVNQAIFTLLK